MPYCTFTFPCLNFSSNSYTMKRLIFLFLLSPVLLSAQLNLFPDTLASSAKHIFLPQAKNNYRFSRNQLIITKDADYKSLFADSVHARLPKIDFERYELVGKSSCIQCMTTCKGHPQCHRNACMYTRSWYLVEKKQRITLAVDTLDASICSYLPGFMNELICRNDSSFSELKKSCPSLKNDTVDFNKRVVVVRELYADCAARFEQEFSLDTIRRCMVWRLYTGYGGCHAMIQHCFIFSVPKPPEGYAIRFEEYGLPSDW